MEGKTSVNFFYFCPSMFSRTSDFSDSKFCESQNINLICFLSGIENDWSGCNHVLSSSFCTLNSFEGYNGVKI